MSDWILRFQNVCNNVKSERVLKFWSEIILVILNQTCVAYSSILKSRVWFQTKLQMIDGVSSLFKRDVFSRVWFSCHGHHCRAWLRHPPTSQLWTFSSFLPYNFTLSVNVRETLKYLYGEINKDTDCERQNLTNFC